MIKGKWSLTKIDWRPLAHDRRALAGELAARTGETLTEVVVVALRERLARETGRDRAVPLREDLAAIRRRCASPPVVDGRAAEDILGFDDHMRPV